MQVFITHILKDMAAPNQERKWIESARERYCLQVHSLDPGTGVRPCVVCLSHLYEEEHPGFLTGLADVRGEEKGDSHDRGMSPGQHKKCTPFITHCDGINAGGGGEVPRPEDQL